MTLATWLDGKRYRATLHGKCYVYPDSLAGDWDLFHLSDYFVSSVTGGAIWLCPRY